MILNKDKNYYFLTNPYDYELLAKSLDKVESNLLDVDSILIYPLFCDYENPEYYKIAFAVYRLARLYIKSMDSGIEMIRLGLKTSEVLRFLESEVPNPENLEEATWKAITLTGMAGSSYGNLWFITDRLSKSQFREHMEKGWELAEHIESLYNDYMGYFYKSAHVEGIQYLTKLGFCDTEKKWGRITVSNMPMDYKEKFFVLDSYRNFEDMTREEKEGAIPVSDENLCIVYQPVFDIIPDDNPLKEEMRCYLPRPENIDVMRKGIPKGNEKAYFDIYKGWVMENAWENKFYLCSDETITRDYGLMKLKLPPKERMTEMEYKRTMQEINKGLYDMAQVLGIPEKSIGNGILKLKVEIVNNSNVVLAYYNPNTTEIVLHHKIGVGSFAHEWFHYLDNRLAKKAFTPEIGCRVHFYTYSTKKFPNRLLMSRIPEEGEEAVEFFRSITKDEKNHSLVYYRESGKTGSPTYHKDPTEVLARVGSRIVRLKMNRKGITSSLCFDVGQDCFPHIPQNEEADYLEPKIEWLIEKAKEVGAV